MPRVNGLQVQTPIVIAGSGRSGTTWVLDVIAEANHLSSVFEPLHPILGEVAERFSNRYLLSEDCAPELRSFMSGVMAGRHPGFWTRYRERPNRLRPSVAVFSSIPALKHWVKRWQYVAEHHWRFRPRKGRPPIIKFIRANLMLAWITANFDCRILFVLRHPLAVTESKLRLGGEDWDPRGLLQAYLDDARLMANLDVDADRVRSETQRSVAAAHAAIWCVENLVPLRQAAELDLVTTFYEHLVLDDDRQEWGRIISALGLAEVPSREALRLPSQQASDETRRRLAEKQEKGIAEIRSRLGQVEVDAVATILERFGVDLYSVGSYLPSLSGHDFGRAP